MADPAYSYQAPTKEIHDMLTGGGGQFGLFPTVSNYYRDQFKNLGAKDSSPFTYSGDRIAGFSPREQYAMQLADQGIGSYLPYLQRSQGLTEDAMATMGAGSQEGAAAMRRAQAMGEDYTRAGLEAGTGYTGEAARRMRQASDASYDPATAYTNYMNPYEEKVVQQSLTDLDEAYLKGDIGRRASEVGSGAFGGARSQLAARDAEDDFSRGAMREVAGIRSQGYGQAQGQAQQEFARQQAAKMGAAQGIGGLGQQLYGMTSGSGQQMYGMGSGTGQGLAGLAGGLAGQYMGGASAYSGLGGLHQQMGASDVGAMMNVGAMDRARNQALMDLNYQNFVGQYNLPTNLMSGYANMITGAGPLAGGTGYSGPAAVSGPTYPQTQNQNTQDPNTNTNYDYHQNAEGSGTSGYWQGGRVGSAAKRFPLSSQRLTGIMSLG